MTEPAHILIVDDDPSIRRMFQLLLTSTSYRVSTAASGEEALAYLELVTPDLILLDLQLPDIDGLQVIDRLKADSSKPFIPVILVTARGDQRSKVEALDAGADDFLVKPVEFDELLARVRAMLRLQRSQRSLRAEQRKTELLLHLTRELGTTLDIDQLLTHFLDRLADAVGAIRASIILITPQPRLFSSSRNRPITALDEILRGGVAGWVLRERQPLIIHDTRTDSRWIATAPPQRMVRSVAVAPIIREGQALGAITLVHHTPGYFTQEHMELLTSVAAQSAIALENARLYRTVADERSTLNAVLDGAADPILLIGPDEELLLANRAAEERLGLPPASGQQLATLIDDPDLLHALDGEGNGSSGSHEVALPDGATFSVSVAPVQGADNKPLGRVAVLQDITAIRELERQEQERLRSVFRRYVSPQVAEEILAGGFGFGEPIERDVVVLFADLRGYTALTEGMDPRVLVDQILNNYFTAMTEVLYRHGGTIDKFLGDGIIGVFGVPIARADDLQRSLVAAVDMQRAFGQLRRHWRAELGLDIGMGIGMGYGRAVVGNIGSVQRLDYTLIGDVVNTASRLNGVARPDQIILSYHLVDALPPDWPPPWPLRPIGRMALKGKQEPHLIYEVEYQEAAIQVG